jgi:hypothetical protein
MNGVAWFSRWQGQKSAHFWQSIFWGQDLQNHWWIAQVGASLLFDGHANQDWANNGEQQQKKQDDLRRYAQGHFIPTFMSIQAAG